MNAKEARELTNISAKTLQTDSLEQVFEVIKEASELGKSVAWYCSNLSDADVTQLKNLGYVVICRTCNLDATDTYEIKW